MNPENNNRAKVLLTAQSALVGEVFPSLRAVCISWGADFVVLAYHVDAELSDDDRDSITSIEAAMAADLPDFETSSEIILASVRGKERDGVCIFARRPNPPAPPICRLQPRVAELVGLVSGERLA
jgi:hypothetical protein